MDVAPGKPWRSERRALAPVHRPQPPTTHPPLSPRPLHPALTLPYLLSPPLGVFHSLLSSLPLSLLSSLLVAFLP
eukprot:scaffold153747_cov31-Tisochrysis_lutea.AAC.1